MANFTQQGIVVTRAALCIGDPDAFASEMIKLINDKKYRYLARCNSYIYISFLL